MNCNFHFKSTPCVNCELIVYYYYPSAEFAGAVGSLYVIDDTNEIFRKILTYFSVGYLILITAMQAMYGTVIGYSTLLGF